MNLLKKIIISYFILLILFTGLIIGVHTIPQSAIKENVVTSTHTLQEEGLYKKFLNFKLFQMDNFTDSYMLNLAISADSKHPIEAGMMNYDYKSKNFMDLAYDTEKVALGKMENLDKSSYGRYWQGYQVTLRPLLTIFTYPQIRILNYIIFTVLIISIIWLLAHEISIGTAWIVITTHKLSNRTLFNAVLNLFLYCIYKYDITDKMSNTDDIKIKHTLHFFHHWRNYQLPGFFNHSTTYFRITTYCTYADKTP